MKKKKKMKKKMKKKVRNEFTFDSVFITPASEEVLQLHRNVQLHCSPSPLVKRFSAKGLSISHIGNRFASQRREGAEWQISYVLMWHCSVL